MAVLSVVVWWLVVGYGCSISCDYI